MFLLLITELVTLILLPWPHLTVRGLCGLISFLIICLMQVHHGVMPSHTMYALNMERILSRLWHPSHEELEQDHVHRQRLAAKDGVLVS